MRHSSRVRVRVAGHAHQPKNILAVATNATSLDARQIPVIYETRWAIEVLMKELKGSLGLGQYQMQSWIGIVRHLPGEPVRLPRCFRDTRGASLSSLAGSLRPRRVALSHLTLTHHAIKRLGAQAKPPHKDVPLPTFSQRLTAFREDLQREQITRFASRIRQPQVRKRVKEFLLTM